jgi:hypothetical protein
LEKREKQGGAPNSNPRHTPDTPPLFDFSVVWDPDF